MTPPPKGTSVLLEARSIIAMITPQPPHIPVIVLELEDGREFALYNVPYEVVRALNMLESGEELPDLARGSIFDILAVLRDLVRDLGNKLEQVVIDEIDYNTYLYTAKASFNLGGIYMVKRMIPSHAIFLAKLFGKPVYVSQKLVDEQEELGRRMREEEEDF
ncbi:MAG: bifunctional nuclease family protein [Thermoproteota archaeon]